MRVRLLFDEHTVVDFEASDAAMSRNLKATKDNLDMGPRLFANVFLSLSVEARAQFLHDFLGPYIERSFGA
jgi:hypothetical protein